MCKFARVAVRQELMKEPWRHAYFGGFGDGFAEYLDFHVTDGGVERHRHGW